jgi:hypothetical protein
MMKFSTHWVLGLLCAACGSAAWAQGTAPAKAAASAALPATAAPAAPAASTPAKTKAHIVVIEDDSTRIEEARNRGTVQRITVQSKLPGVRPYEIQVAPPGRDPSQERGNAGRRAWSIFDF